jgi:hypothetical protein
MRLFQVYSHVFVINIISYFYCLFTEVIIFVKIVYPELDGNAVLLACLHVLVWHLPVGTNGKRDISVRTIGSSTKILFTVVPL